MQQKINAKCFLLVRFTAEDRNLDFFLSVLIWLIGLHFVDLEKMS